MATSSIYLNRKETAKLDIGSINSLQYAKVTLEINGTVIHVSEALPKGQNYYDWAISDSEKALIASHIPVNLKSVKGKMKVDVTWEPWGWDAPLASKEYTVTFFLEEAEDSKPSLVCISKEPSAYTDYVQGKTKLIYKIKAEAKYGATLKDPTASVNGASCTILETDGNGNYVLQSEWLVNSGTNSISVIIKDSRGFSQILLDEIYVHPYAPPTLSSLASELGIACRRWRPDTNTIDDMYGTECRVAVGVCVSYIPGIQTGYFVTYRYKEKGADEWSEYLPVGESNEVAVNKTGLTEYVAIISDGTASNENGELVGKFNTDTEYAIELRVEDNLGEAGFRYEQLRCQETSFNIHDEGDAVSVGKYATRHRCFDSAWDIHSDKNIEADGSVDAKGNVYVGDTMYLKGASVKASAEELNHCKGLKDGVQKQLDNKSDYGHSHSLSEIFDGWTSLDDILSEINESLSNLSSRVTNLENA